LVFYECVYSQRELFSTQRVLSSRPSRQQSATFADPRRFHVPVDVPHSDDPRAFRRRTVAGRAIGVLATASAAGLDFGAPLVQTPASSQQRATGDETSGGLARPAARRRSTAAIWRAVPAPRRPRSTRTPLSSILSASTTTLNANEQRRFQTCDPKTRSWEHH